jgi:hypothetical protein
MQAGVCKNASQGGLRSAQCTPPPCTASKISTKKPPAQRPPAYISVHRERQAVRAGTRPPTTTGRLRVVAMARARHVLQSERSQCRDGGKKEK